MPAKVAFRPFADAFPWLAEALAEASYEEDVEALEHFVFHSRLNGYSNLCLLCGTHTHDDNEHKSDCPFLLARARCAGQRLSEWIDAQRRLTSYAARVHCNAVADSERCAATMIVQSARVAWLRVGEGFR